MMLDRRVARARTLLPRTGLAARRHGLGRGRGRRRLALLDDERELLEGLGLGCERGGLGGGRCFER